MGFEVCPLTVSALPMVEPNCQRTYCGCTAVRVASHRYIYCLVVLRHPAFLLRCRGVCAGFALTGGGAQLNYSSTRQSWDQEQAKIGRKERRVTMSHPRLEDASPSLQTGYAEDISRPSGL